MNYEQRRLARIATGRADAYAAVARAIRHGELPSPQGQACEDCGGAADRYDHRDYGQPLKVTPVCRSCNYRRGPGLPRETKAAA